MFKSTVNVSLLLQLLVDILNFEAQLFYDVLLLVNYFCASIRLFLLLLFASGFGLDITL